MSRIRALLPAALAAAALLTSTVAGAQDPTTAPDKSPAAKTRQVPVNRDEITLSFAPLVEKTAPAVVNIFARKLVKPFGTPRAFGDSALWRLFSDALLFGFGARKRVENALGSGVIVDPGGIVVTNHHVIEDAQGVLVGLADGRIFPANVLVSDKRTDIAVLAIPVFGEPLPHLEFGDSDLLKVGDLVLAIGNPFGVGQTVTSGIVSALARTGVGISDFRFFIQTDAAINPGNSGGAQIDMNGKLVGINTAIFTRSGGSQGIGFAVPSNMVRTVVEAALGGRPLVRPWIGISGGPVPSQLAFFMGVPGLTGVLVTAVHEAGPAARAGLVVGDVVVAVDDFRVKDFESLRYRIATRLVGETARLSVIRGGEPVEIEVDLVAPPKEPPANETWLAGVHVLSGAKVASLSPALAEDLGLDSAVAGVVVLDVRKGSLAAKAGLQRGDVIRSFEGEYLATVAELKAIKATLFKKWHLLIERGGEGLVIEGG